MGIRSAYEASGTSTPTTPTVKDLVYAAETGTATIQKSDIYANVDTGQTYPTFSSATPSICTVDSATGKVFRVADGVCKIVASVAGGWQAASRQNIVTAAPVAIYNSVTDRVAGSLRRHLYDQQMAALSGVTAGAAAQRAHVNGSNGNPVNMSGASYGAVNPNCFVRAQAKAGFNALPLSALDAILAGPGGSVEWAAWITPHHFLTWRGHGVASGSAWVSLDGEIIVEYSATAWSGALCSLLPGNWKTYLPDAQTPKNTEICAWARLYNTYDGQTGLSAERRWVQPVVLQVGNPRAAVSAYQRVASNNTMANGGDSGSPLFMGINGTLVALGHVEQQYQMGTKLYADYLTRIQNAVTSLNASGNYTLTTIDLGPSGHNFTAY